MLLVTHRYLQLQRALWENSWLIFLAKKALSHVRGIPRGWAIHLGAQMLRDLLFPLCPSHHLTSRRWKIKVIFTATCRPWSPCQHSLSGARPCVGHLHPQPCWPARSSGDAGSPSEPAWVLLLCLGIKGARRRPGGAWAPHSHCSYLAPKTPLVCAATPWCGNQECFSVVGNNESCYSCESLRFPPRTLAKWFAPLLPYAPQQCAYSCLLQFVFGLSSFKPVCVWSCRLTRGIYICVQLGEMPGILSAGIVGNYWFSLLLVMVFSKTINEKQGRAKAAKYGCRSRFWRCRVLLGSTRTVRGECVLNANLPYQGSNWKSAELKAQWMHH